MTGGLGVAVRNKTSEGATWLRFWTLEAAEGGCQWDPVQAEGLTLAFSSSHTLWCLFLFKKIKNKTRLIQQRKYFPVPQSFNEVLGEKKNMD